MSVVRIDGGGRRRPAARPACALHRHIITLEIEGCVSPGDAAALLVRAAEKAGLSITCLKLESANLDKRGAK